MQRKKWRKTGTVVSAREPDQDECIDLMNKLAFKLMQLH
jgi:hypothetical protein